MPEAHTDFIIAVIGEELGLVGSLSVLGLFALMAIIMARIAINTDDMFVRLATTGVAVWILMQAIINIGAVLGAVPIAGLPLPLVSYGGSSLTFTLIAIGMVLAFARAQPAAVALLGERVSWRKRARAQEDSAETTDVTDTRTRGPRLGRKRRRQTTADAPPESKRQEKGSRGRQRRSRIQADLRDSARQSSKSVAAEPVAVPGKKKESATEKARRKKLRRSKPKES